MSPGNLPNANGSFFMNKNIIPIIIIMIPIIISIFPNSDIFISPFINFFATESHR